MKLVIHDLTTEDWERIAADFGDCTVVSDNGSIRSCAGCFSCWDKDPGRCVIKDGYENMGSLIHHADEVVVISRYTYGGFSGFVKNVFDRSLGYVLPQLTLVGGESHHQKRYDETKPFSFIFYGHNLSREEKAAAFRYVTAVCANIRGYVKEVVFREGGEPPAVWVRSEGESSGKILLLNGSMRTASGNSMVLAKKLAAQLKTESETLLLRDHLSDMTGLFPAIESAKALVLCMPLYVDGLPSQVVRFFERMQRDYRGSWKNVYVLANMGLYESKQLVNLFDAVRQWCGAMDFAYCGGLGIGAGEVIGTLMKQSPSGFGVTRETLKGIAGLAEVIDAGGRTEEIYAGPSLFPRSAYLAIANASWNRNAKQNGLDPKDLCRRL
jgi:multimeric flavodoxin WrbA